MGSTPVLGNRTSARFRVINCKLQMVPRGLFGIFRNKLSKVSLVDLSTSGLQVISEKTFKNNGEYNVSISAPAYGRPINIKAKAIWHRPYISDSKKQYYRIGFEFTEFGEYALEKIKRLGTDPLLRKIEKR